MDVALLVLLLVQVTRNGVRSDLLSEVTPNPPNVRTHRNNSRVVLQKVDPTSQGNQESGIYRVPTSERKAPRVKCELLPCFNGGECVQKKFCDCGRYNASGSRCQIVYNTGADRENICRTWGQYHFETFDGVYYYYPGTFTYDLLRHSDPDEPSFAIQVHNDPNCASLPYSCTRSVSLYFAGVGEIKLQNRIVLYNNVRVELPFTVENVKIQAVSGYVIVRQQFVFSMAWDGNSSVYLKMSPDYFGRTHGLCGNNNWSPLDDLMTSYGKLTENIEEFVNSWREDLPHKSSSAVPLLYEPPCAKTSPRVMQMSHSMCSAMLREPFHSCHDLVSPFPFMASCTNDLCMSDGDVGTWCQALTEYARSCAHAGHPLHDWREMYRQCAVTCEADLVYNECIACCPDSCHQRKPCIDSEIACVDGCYCTEGLIYENGTCVHPSDCPCDFHGAAYSAGSVVRDRCNNCTCSGGRWICTEETCPAECSITGDFHIVTYDGRKFTFQAPCQYIVTKSRNSGTFTVSVQSAPCGQNLDGSCIQSINLILEQDQRKQVTLTQAGDVLVYDQYKINLPYTDDVFKVRKLSSVFVQVKTDIGLQLLYDHQGLRLYVQLDGRWKDNTAGLCGTFNDNTQDDFLSPVGVPESTPQLFGNSWKTSSACRVEYPPSPLDPCDVHLQAASYASESCSIVTRDLFAPCHPYLSPVSYYEQCRRDTCKCGEGCLCSALAHYAYQCRSYGITIDFRSSFPDCGLSCKNSMVYGTCVTMCAQTCQSLSAPETCDKECAEGCACPEEMYLNTELETCVERSQCPCYVGGMDYQPGENIITSLGRCQCKDGVMSCESQETELECPTGLIHYNCSQRDLDIELSRERTCENQLLNVTASTHLPCVSGCVCPKGLVKHGNECFPPDACPCSWKAKEYFPGEVVTSSCYTCVCHHGTFQCSFRPCPAMCTFYGDRHFRTFDGLAFDFLGTCKVHLVKGLTPTVFSVIVENVNCYSAGTICRKSIVIRVGQSQILFNDESGNPSVSSVMDSKQELHIWQAGFFTFVHFPREDITVLWDQRTTVHVQVGPQWQGLLAGLCGNFDLKTVNEMRSPDSYELTNPQEFGSSWVTTECADSPDIRNPCTLNPLREPFAKKECAILLSEVFEACHPVVDVTWFYSNCLSDTCGCNRGGDCECFCTSVSAYAHQCCQQGISVDWRSPRLCPYDCEFYNKVLGKGPFRLRSYLHANLLLSVGMSDATVTLRGEDAVPGHASSFMLTPGLYRSHDRNLVSLELADRPNYFLFAANNGSLLVAKWRRSQAFQSRTTFLLRQNAWLAGYNALESFAKPGHFLRLSPSSIYLTRYRHSATYRRSTLFKLSESPLPLRSACQWRYDACSSACFRTCRDPAGEHCTNIPKVEGCIPQCPPDLVLDEVTRKCVYFSDCIEPAVGATTLISTREPQKPTSRFNVTRSPSSPSIPPFVTQPDVTSHKVPLEGMTTSSLSGVVPTASSSTGLSVPTHPQPSAAGISRTSTVQTPEVDETIRIVSPVTTLNETELSEVTSSASLSLSPEMALSTAKVTKTIHVSQVPTTETVPPMSPGVTGRIIPAATFPVPTSILIDHTPLLSLPNVTSVVLPALVTSVLTSESVTTTLSTLLKRTVSTEYTPSTGTIPSSSEPHKVLHTSATSLLHPMTGPSMTSTELSYSQMVLPVSLEPSSLSPIYSSTSTSYSLISSSGDKHYPSAPVLTVTRGDVPTSEQWQSTAQTFLITTKLVSPTVGVLPSITKTSITKSAFTKFTEMPMTVTKAAKVTTEQSPIETKHIDVTGPLKTSKYISSSTSLSTESNTSVSIAKTSLSKTPLYTVQTPAQISQHLLISSKPSPSTKTDTSLPGTPIPTSRVIETSLPGTPIPTSSVTETSLPGTPIPTSRVTETSKPGTPIPTSRVTETSLPGTPIPTSRVTETSLPGTTIPTSRVTETSLPGTPIPTSRITEISEPRTPIPTSRVTETSEPGTPIPTSRVTETSSPGTPIPTSRVTETSEPGTPIPTSRVTETSLPGTPIPTSRVTETSLPRTTIPTSRVTETSLPGKPIPTSRVIETFLPGTPIPTSRVTETSLPGTPIPTSRVTETSKPGTPIPTSRVTETSLPGKPIPTSRVIETSLPGTPIPTSRITEISEPRTPIPTSRVTETSEPGTPIPTSRITETSEPGTPIPTSRVTETSLPGTPIPTPRVTETSLPRTPIPTPRVTETSLPGTPIPTSRVTETSLPGTPIPTSRVTEASLPGTPIPTSRVTETSLPRTPIPTSRVTEASLPGTPIPTSRVTETSLPGTPIPTSTVTETSLPGTPIPTSRVTETSLPGTLIPTSRVTETSLPGTPIPTTRVTETSKPGTPIATSTVTETSKPGTPIPTSTVTDTSKPGASSTRFPLVTSHSSRTTKTKLTVSPEVLRTSSGTKGPTTTTHVSLSKPSAGLIHLATKPKPRVTDVEHIIETMKMTESVLEPIRTTLRSEVASTSPTSTKVHTETVSQEATISTTHLLPSTEKSTRLMITEETKVKSSPLVTTSVQELSNITAPLKPITPTGRVSLPSIHDKVPPAVSSYLPEDLSQSTSHTGPTQETLVKISTGLSTKNVTRLYALSSSPFPPSDETSVSISGPTSTYHVTDTSRLTESSRQQTSSAISPSLSPAVSYFTTQLAEPLTTKGKALLTDAINTTYIPSSVSPLSTRSTPVGQPTEVSLQLMTASAPSSVTQFVKPSLEKTETSFVSGENGTEWRALSTAETYKTTRPLISASQPAVVSETLATYQPTIKEPKSLGPDSKELQTSSVTITRDMVTGTLPPMIPPDMTYPSQASSSSALSSQYTLQTGVTSQHPLQTGITSQHPLQTGVTSQHPLQTGVTSHHPLLTGVTSQHPLPTGVTSQHPLKTGVTSQHTLKTTVTSQHAVQTGITSQYPPETDVTSQHPIQTSATSWYLQLTGVTSQHPLQTGVTSKHLLQTDVSPAITHLPMTLNKTMAAETLVTSEFSPIYSTSSETSHVVTSKPGTYVPTAPNQTGIPFPLFSTISQKSTQIPLTSSSEAIQETESSFPAEVTGITVSAMLPSRESATFLTCTPYTENECIKHICVDGQLIQVNKSQHCPYNVTQPSCGLLGFAVQMNGDRCCPKWECACRCSIFSDLSFVTFDGRYLAVYKEALYIILLTEEESITVQVSRCGLPPQGDVRNVTLCLSMLELTYLSNQIIIDRLSRKVAVNSRSAWPMVRKYGYRIVDTGNMYFIETPSNIRIQWFHSNGLMIIESNSTTKPPSMGLCGLCDGNTTNDLILPNGRVLTPSDDSDEFLDSWQVPYTLKYVGKERRQERNCTTVDCAPCFQMIVNQTFSSCHPYVSPEDFCELWSQDVEYIQDPCKALTAYTAMCHKFNVCIEWRNSDYCPFQCPESLIYRPCLPVCDVPRMCQNNEIDLYDTELCSGLTEACVCPRGTVLHRLYSSMCVHESKCACTDSSGIPREIGETWNTSVNGCCMYKCAANETIVPVPYNCSDTQEVKCHKYGEVAVTAPDNRTCCPRQLCLCNQSLCDRLIPTCDPYQKLTAHYRQNSCCPNYTCECDPEKCVSEEPPYCRDDQMLFLAPMNNSCCVRHLCGCSVCAQRVPTCQEGEILTITTNGTQRCCPIYQCVCDTARCPDVTCDLGMSMLELWTPGSCCPYRTCECSCEKIPKPECELGEKLQIDEELMNSVTNPCNCTIYKCVKASVCLSNDGGILRPGQTIIEHSSEGVCHTSHCTYVIDPVSKYHQINVSSLRCATRCQPNQVYDPPRDVSRCCGHCRNVSCIQTLMNGTLLTHRPGSSWIAKCLRYDCTNTSVGPVLMTSAINCPPFNETECIKMGGYVVSFLDGCCKTCKEDGKFCKRVTVRMTIRKNDCRSNTPVNIVSCDGKCPSASIYNYNINTYARFCKCCRELGLQRRVVQLYCTGNSTWINYSIQEPTDCSCQWS